MARVYKIMAIQNLKEILIFVLKHFADLITQVLINVDPDWITRLRF